MSKEKAKGPLNDPALTNLGPVKPVIVADANNTIPMNEVRTVGGANLLNCPCCDDPHPCMGVGPRKKNWITCTSPDCFMMVEAVSMGECIRMWNRRPQRKNA